MARGWKARRSASPEGVVRKHHADRLIFVFTVMLMLVGLLVIYAIGPQRANLLNAVHGFSFSDGYFFQKQLLSVALAAGAFWAMTLVPYEFVLKHGNKVLWAGFIACALLAVGYWVGIGQNNRCCKPN
jgi:cell division protein FtsW (lipid II flippase)